MTSVARTIHFTLCPVSNYNNICDAFMQGRNSFAIHVITEELCYLTIEEALLCLKDEVLPDELRSVYCSLVIGK